MTREAAENELQTIVNTIAREYRPEKIILFGSWVWGTPTADSDVDLLVVKRTADRRVERERVLRRALFGKRLPPLDLLVYTPEELDRRLALGDFFIQEVISRGRLMYGQ